MELILGLLMPLPVETILLFLLLFVILYYNIISITICTTKMREPKTFVLYCKYFKVFALVSIRMPRKDKEE